MKKILALCLVCLMAFGLMACNNGTIENWKTKAMEAPTVELSMESVSFVTDAGTSFNDAVVKSPLSMGKYSPEQAAAAMQQLKCLKNATVEMQYKEEAIPFFTENEQLMYYLCTTTCSIEAPDDDNRVALNYIVTPDDVDGYSVISVEIFTTGAKALKQQQIFEILTAVYGEAYAEYLCYAEMNTQNGYAYHEILNNQACMTFERVIKEDQGAAFAIGVYNINETPVYGYTGNTDLKAHGFDAIASLFGWDKNTVAFDIKAMGTEFVKQYYGDNYVFAPVQSGLNSTPYAYIYVEQGQTSTLSMNYAIGNTEDENSNLLQTQFVVKNEGEVEEATYTLEVGALEASNASGDACAELKQKAMEMLQDILGVEEIFEPDTYQLLSVGGRNLCVKYSFVFAKSGNYQVATLSIDTSNDTSLASE